MRTALLITYYWPPAGGPGVHRWLRFSKYFQQNGWNLHVYCPQDAEWPVIDEALNAEVAPELMVIRRNIFEPHKYLGKKNNPNKGGAFTHQKKPSIIQQLVMWVRGNLFVPDARMFWIKPSTRLLNQYLIDHPEIETIITTGPPHSLHLIGKALKKKRGVKWVADFRDPWTQIDFYNDLHIGKWADARQHKLEKAVLTEADEVITISEQCAKGLEQIAGRKVHVVTNGYEFGSFDKGAFPTDSQFTIAHFGSMPASRNPKILWPVLAEMVQTYPDFAEALKIKLVGPVDNSILEDIHTNGLDKYLELIPQVAHAESIRLQRQTPLLLLVANQSGNTKGILTGKFFEYLGTNRPILAFGETDSDLEKAFQHTECGDFCTYDDKVQLTSALLKRFADFKQGNTHLVAKNLDQYSSGGLAKSLISYL